MTRIAVVVNPAAGGGHASRVVRSLCSGATSFPILETEAPGDGRRRAREAVALGARRVIVFGGDGTVREAAEGLLDAGGEAALGVVPLGNANVVARELRLPRRARSAFAHAIAAPPRPFDVGRANGRVFLAMVGVGVDARIVQAVDRLRRGRLGRRLYRCAGDLLYLVAAVRELALAGGTVCRLSFDGPSGRKGRLDAADFVVANTPRYAKAGRVARGGAPDDGLLDLQAPRRRGRVGRAIYLARLALPILAAESRTRLVRLDVEGRVPFPWHLDGDPAGSTRRLEIEVVPRALRVA